MSHMAFSFSVRGNYAAFMDPRTTSSGVTYYSPTHSAILGMLGAILGVKRPTQEEIRAGQIYGSEFVWLRDNVKVGIKVNSPTEMGHPEGRPPRKAVKAGIKVNSPIEKHIYYTNHVSFKVKRTMPTKTEVLLSPDYTFYVTASEKVGEKLMSKIQKREFAYPIYFGRAYCKAVVHGKITKMHHRLVSDERFMTRCVLPHTDHTMHAWDVENGQVITERQTHHYIKDGKLASRIIPRTIPVEGARLDVILKCPPIGDVLEINGKEDCVVVF